MTRAQRNHRARLHFLARSKPQLPALRERREHQHAFRPRETFADAYARASAKRKIGEFGDFSICCERHRSGSNFSGSANQRGSRCETQGLMIRMEPAGMVYPPIE